MAGTLFRCGILALFVLLHMGMAPVTARGETPAAAFERGWAAYRDRFVQPDGRVVDTYNGNITHSESLGFAMLLAANAGDQRSFQSIWRWTRGHLQREDKLFYWKWDPHAETPIPDKNNASDGDIFIAWSLLIAARRWRDDGLRAEADAIIDALERYSVVSLKDGSLVLLPGRFHFTGEQGITLNPSYYVFPALQEIAVHRGGLFWQRVYEDGLTWVQRSGFGAHDLPADWQLIAPDGTLGLSGDHPPRFGYDAIRVPLYLVWAGHGREEFIGRFQRFWMTSARAGASWVDLTDGRMADYPAEDGIQSVKRLVADTLFNGAAPPPDGRALAERIRKADYYSASLMLLSELARVQGGLVPN